MACAVAAKRGGTCSPSSRIHARCSKANVTPCKGWISNNAARSTVDAETSHPSGSKTRGLCFLPKGGVPMGDILLAQGADTPMGTRGAEMADNVGQARAG